MPAKKVLLLLFITVATHCFSQNIKGTVLSFKYKGQNFQIYTGSKIGLGKGLNADGSFECASREKILRKRETYHSSRSAYQSGTDTDISTGEKEYLGKYYSMGTVTVLKVNYLKKLDEYRIVLGTQEGNYNFYLMHGLKNGEVVAINGTKVPESIPATATGNNTLNNTPATSYETGAAYAVKLKNGSSVNGVLREANADNFKIETADKNLIVFTTGEILEIKKVNESSTSPAVNTTNGDFEIVQSPYGRDTTPAGCFANYTDFGFLILNKVEKTYAGKYGVNLSNTSGYLFKNIFFLGAGIGYTGSFGDSIKYNMLSFSLNQRFFLLGKKKVSPFFSLHEKVGTTLQNASINSGAFFGLGGDIGVSFKVGKKLSIAPLVGYSFNFMTKVLVDTEYYGGQEYREYRKRSANYFVVGVSLGFRSL